MILRLTQIKGKVTDVAAGIAKIEISSDATPRVGDQVEFFFTVPELSERAKAGSGVVAEVHGKTVAVKLSGKPTIRKDGEAIVFSKTPVQQERPFTVGGPRSITIGGASPDVPRTIIVGGDSPPAAPKPKTEGSTAFISTVDFDGKVLDGNKPIADLAMQMDENNLKILHVTVDGLTFDQLGLERSQPAPRSSSSIFPCSRRAIPRMPLIRRAAGQLSTLIHGVSRRRALTICSAH